MSRDIRRILKVAAEQGWVIKINKNGHYVFTKGDETVVGIGAHKQSDGRSIKNMASRLRRAGMKEV